MNIDLRPGITFIESRMVDQCIVQRDLRGNYDEVLDRDTGLLSQPDPNYLTVYQGKCNMTTLREQEHLTEVGQRLVSLRTYRILLPVTVTTVEVGDLFTLTAAAVDSQVIGRAMSVLDVDSRSLPTYRRIVVQDLRNAFLEP